MAGEIPEILMSIAPAETITAPVDPTLSIEGMAADAKATGDAIAERAMMPVAMNVNVAPADWSGSGPYSFEVAWTSMDAQTEVRVLWRSGSATNLAADLIWVTSDGYVTLTTATIPSGTLSLTLVIDQTTASA